MNFFVVIKESHSNKRISSSTKPITYIESRKVAQYSTVYPSEMENLLESLRKNQEREDFITPLYLELW